MQQRRLPYKAVNIAATAQELVTVYRLHLRRVGWGSLNIDEFCIVLDHLAAWLPPELRELNLGGAGLCQGFTKAGLNGVYFQGAQAVSNADFAFSCRAPANEIAKAYEMQVARDAAGKHPVTQARVKRLRRFALRLPEKLYIVQGFPHPLAKDKLRYEATTTQSRLQSLADML